MPRKYWLIIPANLGLILALGSLGIADPPGDEPSTVLAQQSKGVGETIGEKVEDAVQGIKRGARATSESLQEQYQKARASVHDMGVHARAYSRLHWDKDLYNSGLEVEFKGGLITLRGAVKSQVAKLKAVDLARDTVGVERVEDHLTIEPVSATPEPRPTAKPRG
jgi:osmotically-inducible protein OsmY